MGEFDYIRWIREHGASNPRIVVGPGDDCAVLTASTRPTLVTTDMLMEGTDFVLAEAGPRRVGAKAMAASLSDIAAMGGKPVAAFASVALPCLPSPRGRGAGGEGAMAIAEELYIGMRAMADRFGTVIAGGDTNSWAHGLVISVTVLGEPGPQGPILRSGAKPGDWLFVTGPLGGSILGKHLDFTPRVREGLLLQDHVKLHAMIDISDGLAADAHHLCEESGCGLVFFAGKIPIRDAARQLKDGKPALEHALRDGEDFELAFAVDPTDGKRLLRTQPIPGITLAHIGEFVAGKSLSLEEKGIRRALEARGYVHAFA